MPDTFTGSHKKGMEMKSVEERLDRIEARSAIRQLAYKYAIAVDMRDMDAVVNLYVEDVRVTREKRGRQALKEVFDRVLRTFTTSVHFVGNHIIEFDDADNAHGIVYTRAEHEIEGGWYPMVLYYLDIYKRIDGIWYIKRRATAELFVTNLLDPPVGPNKLRWPGRGLGDGTWYSHFPSWQAFWSNPEGVNDAVPLPAPPEKFLDTLRRGERSVIAPDYSWANKS